MSDEGFLRRWARRKTEVQEGRPLAPEPEQEDEPAVPVPAPAAETADAPFDAPAASAPAAAPALPTMADVASLDAESDFSTFVARGVDQAVRRGALKKLFADPHFSVMDKLDVYIDDYTQPSPLSEAMLASLTHAKSVFMRVVEDEEGAQTDAQAEAQAAPALAPVAIAEPEAEPEPEQEAPLQQPPEQETQ